MADPLTDRDLYSLWQSTDHKQTVITSAIPVTLDASVRPGAGARLAVYADTVTIAPDFAPEGTGTQSAFGAGVTIVARELECASAVVLQVTGSPGSGYPAGDSARRGTDRTGADGQAGGKGDPGAQGGNGGAGGQVTIVADAITGGGTIRNVSNGGKGGRGQDGGPGGRGANGAPGSDATFWIAGHEGEEPKSEAGERGGAGGQGGPGGAPGYGGSRRLGGRRGRRHRRRRLGRRSRRHRR